MDCAIFFLKSVFDKLVKKISVLGANKKLKTKKKPSSVNTCEEDKHKFHLTVFGTK